MEVNDNITPDAQFDDLFRVLASGVRRSLLARLDAEPGPVPVESLATALSEATGARSSRQLHIDLYHKHLPVLADAGLIAWNRDAGTVDRTADGWSDKREASFVASGLTVTVTADEREVSREGP